MQTKRPISIRLPASTSPGPLGMNLVKQAGYMLLEQQIQELEDAYDDLMKNYEHADEMMARVVAARWVAEAALEKAADTIAAALEIMKALAQAHGAEYWITPEMEEQWQQIENTLVKIRQMIEPAKTAAGEEALKK